MIRLTSVNVYTFFLNITEGNNKFKHSTFADEKCGGVSYEKVRDEIERDLARSDTTTTDLHNDIRSPIIIKDYRGQVSKSLRNVEFLRILAL